MKRVDITYRIIEDCDTALTYHLEGPRNPITIQTGVGICMIMPCIIPYDDPRLGTNQIISFHLINRSRKIHSLL